MVRLVPLAEIAANGYDLNIGRYILSVDHSDDTEGLNTLAA